MKSDDVFNSDEDLKVQQDFEEREEQLIRRWCYHCPLCIACNRPRSTGIIPDFTDFLISNISGHKGLF